MFLFHRLAILTVELFQLILREGNSTKGKDWLQCVFCCTPG